MGDGTTTYRHTPVDVSGLSSGVDAIAGGSHHTCALTADGGVKCWGWNAYGGQLGDGTKTDRYIPTDVSGLSSGVAAIAGGAHHTCALTTGGGVKCWGWNYYGQVGDGTTTGFTGGRVTPVDVVGLSSGVDAIAAAGGTAGEHTCAVTADGGAKCWGYNGFHQLGDGTNTDKYTPTGVSGLSSGVDAIAAGSYHTCAVTTGGGVKCWGLNTSGQLGDGTNTRRYTPTEVAGFSGTPPPTPSPTPTPSGTPTPTPTATPVGQTPTPTPTATPVGQTPTPTPTATPPGQTPTPTPTATPPGQTPTPCPTDGCGGLPTPTPTPTPPGQMPTPTPTATPPGNQKGDVDCDGDSDSVDALKILRFVAGASGQQGPGCTLIGQGSPMQGDINCDNKITSVDALLILRFVAGLPVNLPLGCPPIG